MKKQSKKLNNYVIRVVITQQFSSLKDIEATSEEEAFRKALRLCKYVKKNLKKK